MPVSSAQDRLEKGNPTYLFLLSLQVLGRLLLSTHWTLDGEQPMHDLYTFQTEFLVSIVKGFLYVCFGCMLVCF